MASISSIKFSGLSAANENALALANIKLDFSIWKVDAPIEFQGLGSALSLGRQHNAEFGMPHRTARRLGALFEDIIPSTPNLISTYGKRVTHIIRKPGVNPEGSATHGPFQSFVGAEGTALWAAATSGIPAIGIYLLACLLARAWEAKESIAIWVELIEGRRMELEEASRSNELVSEGSKVAACQEISRQELSKWDASARAWLRSADEAMENKQIQMMLITRNVTLPYKGGSSTYIKVLEVWKEAMVGMESLLRGQPQMITSQPILLALSAWHLYPNLVILGAKPQSVTFEDDLIPSTGVATIGVESSDNKPPHWSLSLSHFQYYGDPVNVKSERDTSRVSMEQLYIVILGGLLSSWKVRSSEAFAAIHWIDEFGKTLQRVDVAEKSIALGWILHLAHAAHLVVRSMSSKDAEPLRLLKYGHRRGRTFLCDLNRSNPFFGLRNPCIVAGLKEKFDIDCGIAYFRQIAHYLGLAGSEGVIRYTKDHGASYEYTTAIPHDVRQGEGGSDTRIEPKVEGVHTVWRLDRSPLPQSPKTTYMAQNLKHETSTSSLGARTIIINVSDLPSLFSNNNEGRLIWRHSPRLYLYQYGKQLAPQLCTSSSLDNFACPCLAPGEGQNQSEFRFLVGSSDLGLYVNMGSDKVMSPRHDLGKRTEEAISMMEGSVTAGNFAEMCPERLFDYMCAIRSSIGPRLTLDVQSGLGVKAMAWRFSKTANSFDADILISLEAMSVAYDIYRNLEGATISLKIVGMPIYKAPWIPKINWTPTLRLNERPTTDPIAPLFEAVNSTTCLSRAETLACIAYMDTGRSDLAPKHLKHTLAICSENSIYVVGAVLADPFNDYNPSDVRRIVGNIGHSGVCMLVAPRNPRIKAMGDNFDVVNHEPYDLKREDNFQGTSLHLSFTDWSLPLETQATRTIDSDVSFVESVISVRDRGEWVADLDILAIDFENLSRLKSRTKQCRHKSPRFAVSPKPLISLDCWEELIDRPEEGIGFFRATRNWAARLAAVSILTQQGFGKALHVAGSDVQYCIKCLEILGDREVQFCVD